MLLYLQFPFSNKINGMNYEYRITPFKVADSPIPHLLLITGVNFNTQVHKNFQKSRRLQNSSCQKGDTKEASYWRP
jgi:hypothetical protein